MSRPTNSTKQLIYDTVHSWTFLIRTLIAAPFILVLFPITFACVVVCYIWAGIHDGWKTGRRPHPWNNKPPFWMWGILFILLAFILWDESEIPLAIRKAWGIIGLIPVLAVFCLIVLIVFIGYCLAFNFEAGPPLWLQRYNYFLVTLIKDLPVDRQRWEHPY